MAVLFLRKILYASTCSKHKPTRFNHFLTEKGFGAHGHRCSLHFQNLENFKISHFYISKNYEVKYIHRYIQDKCIKKYIIFWEI
jgi:hypothetical protein